MANNQFPVGNHSYFEGDRDLYAIFGIVYCRIVAPKNLYAPILLFKIDNKTIASYWKIIQK